MWSHSDGCHLVLQARVGYSFGIWNLYHLAANLSHGVEGLLAQFLLRPFFPVVSVDDVVGLVVKQVGHIAPFVLWHHAAHAFDVFHHILALFIAHVGQPAVRGDGLVGEQAYHHLAVAGTFVDDVDETRVHDVTNHS